MIGPSGSDTGGSEHWDHGGPEIRRLYDYAPDYGAPDYGDYGDYGDYRLWRDYGARLWRDYGTPILFSGVSRSWVGVS